MRKESSNEVLAFVLLGLTAFLAVCLYTWNPGDTLPGNENTANICGPVGALLSNWIISWFGRIGSYTLTSILAITASAITSPRSSASTHSRKKLPTIAILAILS